MDALWFQKRWRRLSKSLWSKPMKHSDKEGPKCLFKPANPMGTLEKFFFFDTSLTIGWPCLFWELHGADDSYTDTRFPFLATESLPTLNRFLKAVTGQRRLIFNMDAVKWPVWAVGSSLPVLAVVRATCAINTSQLLGNNDKFQKEMQKARNKFMLKTIEAYRQGSF